MFLVVRFFRSYLVFNIIFRHSMLHFLRHEFNRFFLFYNFIILRTKADLILPLVLYILLILQKYMTELFNLSIVYTVKG